MKLSVIIITLNESAHIARALESAAFADELIVVDSFSTDSTVQIAEKMGAQVYQQEFLGYGQQKNWALEKCRGEWVFWLDADEEISSELKQSIQTAIHQSNVFDLYEVNRRTQYLGEWIYHGGWYPDYIVRLFRRGSARFSEPQVHEKIVASKPQATGRLTGVLNHYSFPSIGSQIQVNLKYATLGSYELLERKKRRPFFLELMFKPLGKFFECYFLKRGFLDGKRGFIIAVNAAHSLFMKYSMAYMGSR